MAKPLVIVESGAKAKTIAGFLGSDRYTVLASVGHIRDLPRGAKDAPKSVTKPEVRRLGIDVDDHFAPIYVVPDDKKRVVAELKAALKNASELYLATDEDREGEAISWHLLEVLKPNVPVKRMVFHEITSEAIADAIDNWRELDMKLVEAQEGAAFSIVSSATRSRRSRSDGSAQARRPGACRASRRAWSSTASGRAWRSDRRVTGISTERSSRTRRAPTSASRRRSCRSMTSVSRRGATSIPTPARSLPTPPSCCSTGMAPALAERLAGRPFEVASVESRAQRT